MSALIEWLEAQVAELERHRWSCSWTSSLCERNQYSFTINRHTPHQTTTTFIITQCTTLMAFQIFPVTFYTHSEQQTCEKWAKWKPWLVSVYSPALTDGSTAGVCSSLCYSSHVESSVCIEWLCWPFNFGTKSMRLLASNIRPAESQWKIAHKSLWENNKARVRLIPKLFVVALKGTQQSCHCTDTHTQNHTPDIQVVTHP